MQGVLYCNSAQVLLLACAVLCCAVLCCAVLCCAVLCCAVLCCAVNPPQDHLACGLSDCLSSVGRQFNSGFFGTWYMN